MAQIIKDSEKTILVSLGKGEAAIYSQVMVDKLGELYDDDEADISMLLLIMESVKPFMPYALPTTRDIFNEIENNLNEIKEQSIEAQKNIDGSIEENEEVEEIEEEKVGEE